MAGAISSMTTNERGNGAAMAMLTRRHLILENTIILLVMANLVLPWFDAQHPVQWLYVGLALLFQRWMDMIAWVMSWTDPLLPRTFTFRGVGNLVFATLFTGLILFLLYVVWYQLWKLLWFRQFMQRLKTPFTKIRYSVLALAVIVAGLTIVMIPTLIRLLSGELAG
jgi:hypothetical protein